VTCSSCSCLVAKFVYLDALGRQQMGSGEWLGLTLQRMYPSRVLAERVTTVGDKVRNGVIEVFVFVFMLEASVA
jgi:hypothetical protein